MYPPPLILPELANPKCGNPYGELGALSNITRVWNLAGECLTMEATLPPSESDSKVIFMGHEIVKLL